MDYESIRDGETSMKEEAEFLAALVRAIKPSVCVESGTHSLSPGSGPALAIQNIGIKITHIPTHYGMAIYYHD